MPWWSWVLIWMALVVLLLAMLAWFGYTLFRKAVRTVQALESLAAQVTDVEFDPELPQRARFTPAVFDETADIVVALERERAERRNRRQQRRDHLVARGKLMTQAP